MTRKAGPAIYCAVCGRQMNPRGEPSKRCHVCRLKPVNEIVHGPAATAIIAEHLEWLAKRQPHTEARGNATLLAVWLAARQRAGVGFSTGSKLRRKPKSHWSPPPTARTAAGGTRKRGNCDSDGQKGGMPANGHPRPEARRRPDTARRRGPSLRPQQEEHHDERRSKQG
jgi:hypothetical protein